MDYNLTFDSPYQIDERNIQVRLPKFIFANVADLFYLCLQGISKEDIPKVEQVMRIFLFAKLFAAQGGQDGRTMLSVLFNAAVWQEDELWIKMTENRMKQRECYLVVKEIVKDL